MTIKAEFGTKETYYPPNQIMNGAYTTMLSEPIKNEKIANPSISVINF